MNVTKWLYYEYAEFIYFNEWADSNLKYNGSLYNYYDIEVPLRENFKEYCIEEKKEDNDKNFLEFCKNNICIIQEIFENTKPINN